MSKRARRRKAQKRLRKLIQASAKNLPEQMNLAGTVEITAAEGEGEERKSPRFKIDAYDGSVMRLSGFYHPVIIDMNGVKARSSVKVLRDHDAGRIVGHAEDVNISADGIKVEGVVSGSGSDASEVVASSGNGFPWEASVGASPDRMEFLKAGAKATVNGRTVTGPAYIARKSTLREVSFVAIGAAEKSAANIAAQHKDDDMDPKFKEWLEANGFDPEAIEGKQKDTLEAAWKATLEDDGDDDEGGDGKGKGDMQAQDDPAAQLRASAAGELKRQASIQKLCGNKHPDIAAKAIEEDWTTDRVEAAVAKAELESIRASRGGSGSASAGSRSAETTQPEVIEASMAIAAGVPEKVVAETYSTSDREKVMNAAVSRDFRGFSIHQLLHSVIQASGSYAPAGRVDNDVIRAAFEADRMLQASQGFSTISLSGILGNVANKAMLAAYNAVATVVPEIASETSTNDFKQFKRFRMVGKGEFTEVGPDGELKHVSLQEQDYANQLKTYGALIALTRQMMINDDLGAFTEIPRIVGRMSAINREKQVFTEFLSNPNSFFSAGNNNLLSGAGSALSISGLTDAVKAFWEQSDNNGDPILINPDRVLVPPALRVTADDIFQETRVNETTTTNKRSPNRNPHAGLYQPISSPYLASAFNLTGASDDAWYLLGNPADIAAIEVAYLRGQRTPTIESADTDFNTLGMQWRGYFDFGVAMQDPRAAVKNAGS